MVIMMMLMITVTILVRAKYYAQIVIWALFAYIIACEIIHFIRDSKKPNCDADLMQEIYNKLDKATKDIKSTV